MKQKLEPKKVKSKNKVPEGENVMCKSTKRGYVPTDEKEFNNESLKVLYKAGQDIFYLLNRGYNVKSASVFVGNHYQLSERQRLALARIISSESSIKNRKDKEIKEIFEGCTINIDGFNTIITLEVALSNSLLFKCMDETVRDLAALRGSYRIIDKTEIAIDLIGQVLENNKISKAVFFLDAPVSNSGKLKQLIQEVLEKYKFEVEVQNINNVDSTLELMDNVVTSDAIILDKCKSWININKIIIENSIKQCSYIDFSQPSILN